MLNQRKEYSRYYGGFRGVDFATDDTLVSDARFPYAVNVYKDYVSGAGQGIETIPGFRKRFTAPNGGKIHGIHSFKSVLGEEKVLIHAGNVLYDWESYGKDEANESGSAEMDFTATAIHTGMGARTSTSFIFNNRLYILDGKNYLEYDGKTLSNVKDDAYIPTTYINIIPAGDNEDNGTEYEQRNMLSPRFKHTFIAVKYTDSEGNEKIASEYNMNEPFDSIEKVTVYGVEKAENTDYTVTSTGIKFNEGKEPTLPENTVQSVEGDNAVYYPEFYAGVEITAEKELYEAKDVKIKRADGTETTLSAYRGDTADHFVSMIESATIATTFDNRVFFSGIPGKPNLVLYCGRNTTGYADPSYIGILNYVEDGVGTTPITAMLGVAGTLLVLKNDTQQDGSVYYHTPTETGENILPKIYPSTAGLAGTGCLGAALNFLDDPVFISKRGLEAVSQLKIAAERSIEHRSSLVDAKLLNTLALECASLCEYGGYLVVLCEGKIFLADSRQLYQNSVGNMEYEWYFLDEIGVYKGQSEAYFYLDYLPPSLMGEDGSRKNFTVSYRGKEYAVGVVEDIPEAERIPISSALEIIATEYEEKEYAVAIVELDSGDIAALLCDTVGEMTGGVFSPATIAKTIGDNLYFGTHSGDICSFNFDKRNKTDGTIAPSWYTFNKRAIYSGVALKNDNCGMPGMVKSTVKRSLVAKVKNFAALAAKIGVKTNKKSMSGVGNISANRGIESFFGDMDFANFSFIQDADSIFTIREKEKKWVEKQYFIYTDTYMKPFALFYATFKYTVIGKYKG